MPVVNVFNVNHDVIGTIDLADDVFGSPCADHLFHLVVRSQLAARQQGTHAAKTRSFVAGGGKKPWRQKGTGRARQGSSRAPHWRGGGVVFGPHPRQRYVGVTKRVRRAALRGAITKRTSEEKLVVVDSLSFDSVKTKLFASFIGRFGLSDVLVVTAGPDTSLDLMCRNIPGVTLMPVVGVNVYDVLKHKNIVFTKEAVAGITARLQETGNVASS